MRKKKKNLGEIKFIKIFLKISGEKISKLFCIIPAWRNVAKGVVR